MPTSTLLACKGIGVFRDKGVYLCHSGAARAPDLFLKYQKIFLKISTVLLNIHPSVATIIQSARIEKYCLKTL